MGVYVYRPESFYGLIEELKAYGGRGALAAEKAERIMKSLCKAQSMPRSLVSRHTRYGERRIENCRKFDLGSGYRLVYVKHRRNYVFLFVGTHDDCDRWMKNHRGLELEGCEDVVASINLGHEESRYETDQDQSWVDEMDYDEILMSKIDQRLLRKIFRGICGL